MILPALLLMTAAAASSDPLVDALSDCIALADPTARAACFDRHARALVEAVRSGELAVIRREALRRTRRSLFGIDGDPAANLPGASVERIDELETTVASASRGTNDHWTLRLTEGGRWETTEAWLIGRDPKAGTPVSIHRASLGGYVLRVRGERSVRVRRLN